MRWFCRGYCRHASQHARNFILPARPPPARRRAAAVFMKAFASCQPAVGDIRCPALRAMAFYRVSPLALPAVSKHSCRAWEKFSGEAKTVKAKEEKENSGRKQACAPRGRLDSGMAPVRAEASCRPPEGPRGPVKITGVAGGCDSAQALFRKKGGRLYALHIFLRMGKALEADKIQQEQGGGENGKADEKNDHSFPDAAAAGVALG